MNFQIYDNLKYFELNPIVKIISQSLTPFNNFISGMGISYKLTPTFFEDVVVFFYL
jgi:hypothetical protein